jgi:hypothetical protein
MSKGGSMSTTSPSPGQSSVGVNLTQLNAFNQYLVGRTGVMLTTGGLTAATAGILQRFHSDIQHIAPGVTPWLLYMAAVLIPVSAILAPFNLPLGYRLQSLLAERFGEEIRPGDTIQIPMEDGEILKRSRARQLKSLDLSFVLLVTGITALVFHIYALYISDDGLPTTFDGLQTMNLVFVALTLFVGGYASRRLMRRLSVQS